MPEEQEKTLEGNHLEEEKLSLEIATLKRQLSRSVQLLEWIKAVAGPVAIAGLIWTVYLGISQRHDVLQNREDERFERAISRTGSVQVSERLIGITELSEFLTSHDVERNKQALDYLVNAAVIEQDATVRSAITDVFNSLEQQPTASEAMQSALVLTVDRNRAILKRFEDDYYSHTRLVDGRSPSGSGYTEVPIGKLSPEQLAPLQSTATILAALVRAGAKVPDMSGIYCLECHFGSSSRTVDLSGVLFDGAFLGRASFEKADLAASSFHDADLVLTKFIGADLRQAKITADTASVPWEEEAAIASNTLQAMWGADFTCANLTDADFSGRPIFTFIYDNPVVEASQQDNFSEADLTRAKLTGFQFLFAVPSNMVGRSPNSSFLDMRNLFPGSVNGSAGPSQSVTSIEGKEYLIWSVTTGADFRFTQNVDPKAFWDLILAFRQLHSARNLLKAEMPNGLREFLLANDKVFSPSLGATSCKGR